MDKNEISLDEQLSDLKIGRYETVNIALEWLALKRNDEEYRKLVDVDLITRALQDIADGKATRASIKDLRLKQQKNKDAKEKEKDKEAAIAVPEAPETVVPIPE
ncbi:MAG: hypothetical protein LBV16_06690 [Elusimicrobiota bacterium]|jgi:hypothetical protein|nr:hypothetical protein [Elusimicrobiota bacterium]